MAKEDASKGSLSGSPFREALRIVAAICIGLMGVLVVFLAQRNHVTSLEHDRLKWAAFLRSHCVVDGKASRVTLGLGVDPRPEARLTIYKCRDGSSYATTNALESQLEADLVVGMDLDADAQL